VSVVGQHLLASWLGDRDRERDLIRYLDGDSGGPESAFWLAAAELAARRCFGSEYHVRAVTRLAAEARDLAVAHDLAVFPLLEIEAVYRSALGEDNIDLSGIKPVNLDKIRGGLVAMIAVRQGWPESEVRDLIIEAERITFDCGWQLPLAADVLGAG
jgi:hypothetical protein